MATVNTQSLRTGLDQLREMRIITGWEKRPFGMYHIGLAFADDLRPDTKETAMWVMGAMYGTKMQIMEGAVANLVGADQHTAIEGNLEILTDAEAVLGWARDEDGDYVVQLRGGKQAGFYAKDMLMWTLGALTILAET